MLSKNLAHVRARIREACQRGGRDPSSVLLVCVTKGEPPEAIRQALALGVTELGENRVQEARAKIQALGSGLWARGSEPSALSPEPKIRWHLIGHLQRNKAKDAVTLFDVIHSVDSMALAEELESQASKGARGSGLGARPGPQPSAISPERHLEVFVQVNVSGETTKFGCKPEEASSLAQAVCRLPHLRLVGLMTMAPFVEDPEQARPHFRHLRALRDTVQQELLHSALRPPHSALLLSMGMSHDFEVAIEEGADVVRIGTAIFKGQGA